MADPLKPDSILLVKLGSIVVHAQEYVSPDGHEFDRMAMITGLADGDVIEWINEMTKLALVPVKRK